VFIVIIAAGLGQSFIILITIPFR